MTIKKTLVIEQPEVGKLIREVGVVLRKLSPGAK
jgi:hypothetical protein